MRISDWSSDVCSSDLLTVGKRERVARQSNFDETLRGRIDAAFPSIPGDRTRDHVGSIDDFDDALRGYHGACQQPAPAGGPLLTRNLRLRSWKPYSLSPAFRDRLLFQAHTLSLTHDKAAIDPHTPT